jgi:hypothetical protein
MPSNSDKWIRSLKDNPAGKVVADPEGNRFEWESQDDTSLLLKKLNNDELAIEKTDLYATSEPAAKPGTAASPAGKPASRPLKPGGRDSGGGFNPYDHAGKKRR